MSRHLPYSDLPIQQDTILVLIPALDEQNTIGSVIEELKQIGLNHIRVVDNGSSDKTVEVAKMTGAEVMFEKRRGYGQACWMGLQNIPSHIKILAFLFVLTLRLNSLCYRKV